MGLNQQKLGSGLVAKETSMNMYELVFIAKNSSLELLGGC
jgi:hypothetical protein